VRDKDGGETTYGPFSVSISAAATQTVVDDARGQYSDPLSLSATLSSNAGADAGAPQGSMEFFIDGASVGSVPVTGDGAVTLGPLSSTRLPGSYSLSARFTPTSGGNFVGSTAGGSLSIGKENVGTE
jgi:hypothetical protein